MWGWSIIFLAAAAPISVAAGAVGTGVVLVGALVTLARDRDALREIPPPVGWSLLAFLAASALATALSPYEIRWAKWVDETWIKLLVVAIPVLRASSVTLTRAMLVFLGVSSAVGVYAMVQHYTGIDLWRGGTTNLEGDRYLSGGFFGHHLTYGGHALVAWCLAVAFAADRLRGGLRSRGAILGGTSMVILSLALLWSQARSAQLAAIVGGAYLALVSPARIRRWLIAAAVVVVVVGAFTPSLVNRFRELGDLSTEETRLNLWKSSWRAIQARPLVGYGPGNFGPTLADFEVPGFYESRSHAHQDYIMHLMNWGLLGLATALSLLVGITLRLLRRASTWAVKAGAAAILSLAAAGMFQVYQSDDEVEMSLYLVVGLALALANRRESAPA